MILKNGTLDKAKKYIEFHSKLNFDKTPKYKPGTKPFITISRESGAGADIISQKLIDLFNHLNDFKEEEQWLSFDKNLIDQVINDHNLPNKLKEYLVEDKYPMIKSIMNELLGLHPPTITLLHQTVETILQLAQMGNVIIVGRASNIVTSKLKYGFHIRLVAPREIRVKHVMEVYDIHNEKDAYKFMEKEDKARHDYVMTNFHKQIDDPLLYHLILNTHLLSYDECTKIIANAVITKYSTLFNKEVLNKLELL